MRLCRELVKDYFRRLSPPKKTQKSSDVCNFCGGTVIVDNRSMRTCSACGVVHGQFLDTSITQFGHWADPTSPAYRRERRCKTLLHELNGTSNIPEEVLTQLVKAGIVPGDSHRKVRQKCIELGGKPRKYQHRSCSILTSLGHRHSVLSHREITAIVRTFIVLDKAMFTKHNLKCSFTLFIPVLLALHGRIDKLACCKPVSSLLVNKYMAGLSKCIDTCCEDLPIHHKRYINELMNFLGDVSEAAQTSTEK